MAAVEPAIIEEEKREIEIERTKEDKEPEQHPEEDEKQEEEDLDKDHDQVGDEDELNSDFEDYSLTEKRDNLVDGDYVVQVHIIEGRELNGRGWNAMSDPVISVECMNHKQSTEIKKNCINAVWDSVLFFEFKDLDSQEINEGKCIISAFDANNFTRNVLIGLYEFDLSTIYFNNKYHEIYKKWIGLYDVTDEHDGIQGYLKISIVVLGPNDEQKTHKLVDEDEDETNLLSVLLPPTIEQIPYLLSISIYEYIKPFQLKNKMSSPFVLVEFAGCKIKSKVVTKDSNNDDIVSEILCQLQIPVMEPILSQSIKISLFNYHRAKQNDKIASLIFDYKLLKNENDHYNEPNGIHYMVHRIIIKIIKLPKK